MTLFNLLIAGSTRVYQSVYFKVNYVLLDSRCNIEKEREREVFFLIPSTKVRTITAFIGYYK